MKISESPSDGTTWPQWTSDEVFRTKNFQFIGSVSDFSGKTDEYAVSILKNRYGIEIYLNILNNLTNPNIFEIGVFEGGMALFLADMADPKKIVGIDFNPPSQKLQDLIRRFDLTDRVKLYGGLLQDNIEAGLAILKSEFGNEPLDLITDDCSHKYYDSKTCFENYFGYLKPGGKYIIEDWGWLHWPGDLWQTATSPFFGQRPMTDLVFQIIMVMASHPELVSRVDIASNAHVVVTRGHGLQHGDRIDLEASYLTSGRSILLFGDGDASPVTPIFPEDVISQPPPTPVCVAQHVSYGLRAELGMWGVRKLRRWPFLYRLGRALYQMTVKPR